MPTGDDLPDPLGSPDIPAAPAHRGHSRSVRELPAAERPRERLAARGPSGLSAAELIAVVWGTGSGGRTAVDLAEDALARHASVGALARASDVELSAIPGIGAAKAARLAAAFELGRRSVADWPTGRWTIRSPRDVADRLMVEMSRLEREELRVLSLNAKNVVVRASTCYVGNVSASLVRVGELFRDAVRLDASGVVLVHNHPSGDPHAVTRRSAPDGRGDCSRPHPRRGRAGSRGGGPRRVGEPAGPRRHV